MTTDVLDDELVELRRLGDVVAGVDVSGSDRAGCERVLSVLAVLRRRIDGCEIRVTRRLEVLADADPAAPSAGEVIARATRRDGRAGTRAARRARTCATVLPLGRAVERGDVSGEHVDVVAEALARLPASLREPFVVRHGDELAVAASTGTPGELRTLVTRLVVGFEDEQTRQTRLGRQRRANRLRTWIDRVTGMVRLSGELDPERGQALLRRLHDEVEARFHGGVPDTAPDDPGERADHLRALALCGIVLGDTASGGEDCDAAEGPGCDSRRSDPGARGASGGDRGDGGRVGQRVRRRPETITVIEEVSDALCKWSGSVP